MLNINNRHFPSVLLCALLLFSANGLKFAIRQCKALFSGGANPRMGYVLQASVGWETKDPTAPNSGTPGYRGSLPVPSIQ